MLQSPITTKLDRLRGRSASSMIGELASRTLRLRRNAALRPVQPVQPVQPVRRLNAVKTLDELKAFLRKWPRIRRGYIKSDASRIPQKPVAVSAVRG